MFGQMFRRRRDTRRAQDTLDVKTSRTAPLIAFYHTGRPVWTPQDYTAQMREGYQQNPIVYRAVRMIAEAVAQVPIQFFDGRREVSDTALHDLLKNPNQSETATSFTESLVGYLLLSGNGYCEAVSLERAVTELYVLRPDRMRVVPGSDGWPLAYDYTLSGNVIRYDMTGDGIKPILHIKLFDPLDDHYGLSPISAAARAIDSHNAASIWNKALLDNAARPSGALVYSGASGNHLTTEQFDRLKKELSESYEGSANAGRPLLLEGGLDWKPLSLTPKDMDFMEAKAAAARDIALAFGIPPLLLGLPGDNTYANLAEAQKAFWRQTAIPLAIRLYEQLAIWLAPAFGTFTVTADLDRIPALSSERDALWARINAASFLTDDEKREAVGYGIRKNMTPQG